MSDPSPDNMIPMEDFLGDISPDNDITPGDPYDNISVGTQTDEPIEDVFADATTPIGDGVCIVCGAPTFRPPGLTKAGHRRRTPKHCDLHDPKLRIQDDGPVAARLESQLARVQQELADDLRLGGTLIGFQLPVTGYYIIDRADPFTTALLKLCKNNQRMLRVLHRAASVAPIYEIAKDVAGTAYAAQVDLQKADPHNTMADRLGVQRAYEAIYGRKISDASGTSFNPSSNGFTGPPRYATVP